MNFANLIHIIVGLVILGLLFAAVENVVPLVLPRMADRAMPVRRALEVIFVLVLAGYLARHFGFWH